MSKWNGLFAQWGDYIVTASADKTITLNAKIVAKIDGDQALRDEMIERANEAPAMAELLRELYGPMRGWLGDGDPEGEHGDITIRGELVERTRALLARIGAP